jgi:2-haloacid dehalogenase
MQLYLRLEPFPEVPGVLRELKRSGYKLAILSNGSPRMLAAAVENALLDGIFDAVLSVEEVGVFRPHPRVYRLATERLSIPAGAIAFRSFNAWDARAASAFGMRTMWCNGYGQRKERLPGDPDREVKSLAELPAILSPH